MSSGHSNKYPKKSKKGLKEDGHSSDSFSNSPSYNTNNTPDHFKSKIQPKPLKKAEFTSSVQEFLKQSTEIQDEIRRLSEICQQISPKFQDNKIEVPEKIDWDRANEVLASLGYSEMEIENGEVSYEILTETFLELLNDFSNQKGILDQNKETLLKNEKEIDSLLEKIKELETRSSKPNKKNFEAEIQELEKMTREMESRYRKLKEKLRQKDLVIKEILGSFGLSEKLQVSPENAGENTLKVFQFFMHRYPKEKSKIDKKILSIIESYESKGEPGQFQVVLDELEVYSITEALALISKLKQESVVYQETEKVIQELFYQLFNKPISGDFSIKYEVVFDEILGKVNETLNNLKYLEEFKRNVVLALGCKKGTGHNEIVDKIQVANKIRKLFQIQDDGNENQNIENLFLFVHEMKVFLKRLRACLGKDLGVAEIVEEVLNRLG